MTFSVGDENTHRSFIQRLAKERGWSVSASERAFEEYKKFLYLGAKTNEMVTPSDAIDQVWHLHLLYTKSYWNDLCGEVLKRSFHHGPSNGGKAEEKKFGACYLATLQAYKHHFGSPPADLWPVGSQRQTNYQRVDLIALQRSFAAKSFLASALSFIAGVLISGSFFLWN
jgi:hypothetical protein